MLFRAGVGARRGRPGTGVGTRRASALEPHSPAALRSSVSPQPQGAPEAPPDGRGCALGEATRKDPGPGPPIPDHAPRPGPAPFLRPPRPAPPGRPEPAAAAERGAKRAAAEDPAPWRPPSAAPSRTRSTGSAAGTRWPCWPRPGDPPLPTGAPRSAPSARQGPPSASSCRLGTPGGAERGWAWCLGWQRGGGGGLAPRSRRTLGGVSGGLPEGGGAYPARWRGLRFCWSLVLLAPAGLGWRDFLSYAG